MRKGATAIFKFKFEGITKRWMTNIVLVVAIVLIVTEIFIGVFIRSYYYESVKSQAIGYSQSFSLLATVPKQEYNVTARQYIENFEHKDKLEIQILDNYGNVIITSNGFEPDKAEMPDYNSAKLSASKTGNWVGVSTMGENVMAQTTIFGDYGSGSNGAVRWIISLDNVNKHIFWLILLCVLIGFGVLIFTFLSGIFFVKSIINPVREVSSVARKIAMGDFKSRLEAEKNDEIGELCDAINYMASELHQAENLKNSFISSVSHELRTPLTAIRGWGETAKMSLGQDNELVDKGLEVILTESDRLSGLVEDLLDFSRMQSGRLSVNMRVLNISTILREAADMYMEVGKQQNIRLDFICPDNLSVVMGDPDRLKQVFINIIDNAIKYSNEGGYVLVDAHEEENCIHIKVSDTGVGIPEQDIYRVKEKFFKSNTTVRGSGIGLAVADEIVKMHNGLLFIESKEGVGTTVTIVIPVTEETVEVEEPIVAEAPLEIDTEYNILEKEASETEDEQTN